MSFCATSRSVEGRIVETCVTNPSGSEHRPRRRQDMALAATLSDVFGKIRKGHPAIESDSRFSAKSFHRITASATRASISSSLSPSSSAQISVVCSPSKGAGPVGWTSKLDIRKGREL